MKANAIQAFLGDSEKVVSYETGSSLRGFNFIRKEGGWLCVVKVTSVQGKAMVAFIHAQSPWDCLEVLCQALHTTTINLTWREDKYGGG